MTKDMIGATTAITTKDKVHEFQEFGKIYPFTTENIKDYAKEAKGKRIITVNGSGDHYFNFIAEGAENVTVFDINKLTIHYLKLKKAIIENLPYNEFFDFYNDRSKKKYNELRDLLDQEEKEFWDYIYLYFYNRCKLTSIPLFYSGIPIEKYKNRNNYFQEETYEILQQRLKKQTIKFINTDINNLCNQTDKEYDGLFCSNIYLYQNIKEYIQKVRELTKLLKKDGKIYYAYLYHDAKEAYQTFLKELPETEEIEVEAIIDTFTDNIQPNDKNKVLYIKK